MRNQTANNDGDSLNQCQFSQTAISGANEVIPDFLSGQTTQNIGAVNMIIQLLRLQTELTSIEVRSLIVWQLLSVDEHQCRRLGVHDRVLLSSQHDRQWY